MALLWLLFVKQFNCVECICLDIKKIHEYIMTNKIQLFLSLSFTLLLIVGCTSEAPKCSDKNTLDTVKRILIDQLDLETSIKEDYSKFIRFEFPRASSYDEKVQKYSCDTQLYIDDKLATTLIYESQIDDNSGHIVSISGMRAIDILNIKQLISDKTEKKSTKEVEINSNQQAEIAVESEKTNFSEEQNKLIAIHTSQYPTELVEDLAFNSKFKELLGESYEAFHTNLSVASNVVNEGKYLFGQGCMPHACGSDIASFAIDLDTGLIYAAMLTDGSSLRTFGTENREDFPPPLLNWMNEAQ